MQIYKASRTILAYHFSLPLLFTLVLAFMLGVLPRILGPDPLVMGFLVIWSVGVVWGWYQYLTTVHEITLLAGGAITLRAVARTVTMRPDDIRSIGAGAFDPYFVTLRYREGTVVLFPQIDGFHDFLVRVKALNPRIVTRGV